MNHHLLPRLVHTAVEGPTIAEVAEVVVKRSIPQQGTGRIQAQVSKQRALRLRREGIPPDLRAEVKKLEAEPTTLEARVTGDQNPPSSPK